MPPRLPEQAGERVRGGTVAAAVGASTGPRQSASGLSLPGQKLLHRRQVSRTRRIKKLLLLPHCCYHKGGEKKQEARGGEGEEGVLLVVKFLRDPLFSPPNLKLFLGATKCGGGNKSSLRPAGPSVPLHGAAGAQRAKVSVSSTVPTIEQTSSDQSSKRRPSLP